MLVDGLIQVTFKSDLMAYRVLLKGFCAVLQEIPGLANVSWTTYVALVACTEFQKKGGPVEDSQIAEKDVDLALARCLGRKVIFGAAMYLQLKSVMLTREGLVILILENIFFTLMETSWTLDFIFLESLLQIRRKGEKKSWGLGLILHVSGRILVFNLNKIDFINSD